MINSIRKKRIGDIAIVVINNKIYNRSNVDDKEWIEILELCEEVEQSATAFEETDNYEKLLLLLDPELAAALEKEAKEAEKALKELNLEEDVDKRMANAIRIADISGLFEYDEAGITYLKGFKHPMPKILVEALLDAHYNPDSRYSVNSLVNFWKYLLLNPDKHVRTSLFKWIDTSSFALTEEGNIIAYRNVDVKQKGTDKKLEDAVSKLWLKIKKQKKSPKNFSLIMENGEYKHKLTSKLTEEDNSLGIIADLNEKEHAKEEGTVYTDYHTHTMEIKLNEVVSMPRSETNNDPNDACSKGLHAKSTKHTGYFGDNTIVILVNPWNVVAVPKYDTTKFRCCEYLPVAKAETNGRTIVELDPGTYDIAYNGLENLTKLLDTKSLKDLQDEGTISVELEGTDFDFIMKEAKDVISKRVVTIK